MPHYYLDIDDCSLIVSALVHYAGESERTDSEANHAIDLVEVLSFAARVAPADLVRERFDFNRTPVRRTHWMRRGPRWR